MRVILGAVSIFQVFFAWAQCNIEGIAEIGVGTYWGIEMMQVDDSLTRRTRFTITDPNFNSLKIYQTHPSWTYDGDWIIFTSTRTGQKEIFAVNQPGSDDCFQDFSIIQLTSGSGLKERPGSTPEIFISQIEEGPIYYLKYEPKRSIAVVEIDFYGMLRDLTEGIIASSYETILITIDRPENLDISGGLSMDASKDQLYVGINHTNAGEILNELLMIDLRSGQQLTLHEHIGKETICHIQANPWVSGEILFCQNDLNQRMYLLNAATGQVEFLRKGLSKNKAMDNVTHETWYDQNTVAFNLNSVHPEHKDFLDVGVYLIDKSQAGNETAYGTFLTASQDTTRRFLHQATRNGIMIGDLCQMHDYRSLSGELWLYEFDPEHPGKGDLSLLTRDTIRLVGTHAHQSISPDGRWVLVGARQKGHQLMLISLE